MPNSLDFSPFVLPLIAEMKAKSAVAEAAGDKLTAELCTQVLASVLPLVPDHQSPIPSLARAKLSGAWLQHTKDRDAA